MHLRTLAIAGLIATASLALTAVPALEPVSPVGQASAYCTTVGGPTACLEQDCDTAVVPPCRVKQWIQ